MSNVDDYYDAEGFDFSGPYYDVPDDLRDTVFDPYSDTFGPIMAALQGGDFHEAAALTDKLAEVHESPTDTLVSIIDRHFPRGTP